MSELHPDQVSPAHAEQAFDFLLRRGFTLRDRFVSEGKSFKDGWRLSFESPAVLVTVEYFDWQLEVHFERAGARIDYLFIDRERFHRRSGFHGNMFPPQELAPVIDQIAMDIRDRYAAILDGDEKEWTALSKLAAAPKTKRRLPE